MLAIGNPGPRILRAVRVEKYALPMTSTLKPYVEVKGYELEN
jgi:hypothetical protein